MVGNQKKIGVLALQGAVREHIHQIEQLGHIAIPIKRVEQLNDIDGLVLPGGESTTMRRLLDEYDFTTSLRQSELPMYGTCAGLILLAKSVQDREDYHIGKLDIHVERNAFGRQIDSFETMLNVTGIDHQVEAIFIRAPIIKSVDQHVEVLSTVDDNIVAVKQGKYLGVSFHPELSNDLSMMKYFIEQVID
ncbi:pyridoxal 5'-phosphate synthase glutaminase subunit PdxT [Abyssicoccus albus]|uniref:pyridoxal 5'-phosphate synthase glutaminase subunit PdxT n=1 Tax=Abyssicoccus albus TaxID=1817405 RepID=UPI00097E33D0|nr:pyridoxal 5'-phosphate synthase glutaminase subunit PdxT [Abyssicoccus albus]AQL56920.1 glutamine amidotransferase subunit PdxT [Abyssicoccus albus]